MPPNLTRKLPQNFSPFERVAAWGRKTYKIYINREVKESEGEQQMAQSDAKFPSQTKPWIVRDQCRQNCMQISPGLQLCVRNWPHQKGKEKAGIKKKGKDGNEGNPSRGRRPAGGPGAGPWGGSGVGNRSTTISRWKALSLGSDCKM